MYDLNERVSYLQGLIEGLKISEETNEGKAIKVMADIIEEMAYVISDVLVGQDEIEEYVNCIDDDLADLEEEIYTGEYVDVYCPECGAALEIEPTILIEPDTEIICSECGEVFTPDDIDWADEISEFDENPWENQEIDDEWDGIKKRDKTEL